MIFEPIKEIDQLLSHKDRAFYTVSRRQAGPARPHADDFRVALFITLADALVLMGI